MKRLGTVLQALGNDVLIVRGDEQASKSEKPRINSSVMDKTVKRIGKVTNYFGPVANPYYTVKLDRRGNTIEARHYLNERLYVQ
ncbi:MAG: H/ACA ribonucleoprotein complex subunit GAR1 [Methanomethylovorans sp.]|uniref:H/ACA ribonucleoprotein complex subunit GAR1 n=1 Tax=Methanomethylovorans sp. TaxID=2758717 RepID=UPI0009CEFAE8|nr:MAG: H/ACA RNA-protein complex component Gar1 [Methanomethylovorans sp. PtaU1.Bin073]